jgi:hypothetical protein
MIAYQPCRIRSLLADPQARASVSMLVWPPLTQSVMWCNAAKLGSAFDENPGRLRMSFTVVVWAFRGVVFGEMASHDARVGAVSSGWI